MTAGHPILAEGLVRRFGDFTAVDDVSFHVERGEIFGYLGANGAGKSTTIRMLCGLLEPSAGRGVVAGRDVARDPEGVKSRIGYMSQRFSLYLDLPVQENLEFFGGAYGLWGTALRRRIDEVLELTGLQDRRRDVTGELPGGIRQRLALGNALLHDPGIVFLDEPTAGVDPEARRLFWDLIRRLAAEGTTVFVTTHYMDEAEHCRRVGLMVAGRLVALDTPAELKRRFVPGRVLAVQGRGLGRGAERLGELPGVLAVEVFGAGLHVRIDPEEVEPSGVEREMAAAGAAALRIEAVTPSLEDVFLSVVSAHEGAAGGLS